MLSMLYFEFVLILLKNWLKKNKQNRVKVEKVEPNWINLILYMHHGAYFSKIKKIKSKLNKIKSKNQT